jgi:hypothetical protein
MFAAYQGGPCVEVFTPQVRHERDASLPATIRPRRVERGAVLDAQRISNRAQVEVQGPALEARDILRASLRASGVPETCSGRVHDRAERHETRTGLSARRGDDADSSRATFRVECLVLTRHGAHRSASRTRTVPPRRTR